jgi:DNA helicase-2/ATP-dependent DNA helicase PcrA
MSLAEAIRARLEDDFLTPEQLEVCYREGAFVVQACPGSGKTRTIAAKSAWMMTNWPERRSGVAVLSFTNVACEEIGRYLVAFGYPSPPPWPHFLGTIDSFVNQFIFLPFGHVVMGPQAHPRVIHPKNPAFEWVRKELGRDPRCRRQGCDPTSLEFQADGSLKYVGDYRPPCVGSRECVAMKRKMVSLGYATPSDAMYWAMKLLQRSDIARPVVARFPVIMIDEAQDTSETQVNIIKLLAQHGCRIVLVGDPDQAIYSFNGARPDLFVKMQSEWPVLKLTVNFRSSQKICDAAFLFSETLPHPSEARGPDSALDVKPILVRYDPKHCEKLVPYYLELLRKHSIPSSKSVILAWSHAFLERLTGVRVAKWPKRIPHACRALAQATVLRDRADFGEAHSLVRGILRRLCLENPLSSSPIASDQKFWQTLSWELLWRLPDATSTLSTWGPTVRTIVQDLLTDFELKPQTDLGRVFRACNKPAAMRPIKDFVQPRLQTTELSAKVIHRVKGETYESVMVVASPGKGNKDDDLTQWLTPTSDPGDDRRRIAYVAVTRPRKLLVLAAPSNLPQEILSKLSSVFDIQSEVI